MKTLALLAVIAVATLPPVTASRSGSFVELSLNEPKAGVEYHAYSKTSESHVELEATSPTSWKLETSDTSGEVMVVECDTEKGICTPHFYGWEVPQAEPPPTPDGELTPQEYRLIQLGLLLLFLFLVLLVIAV